MDLKQTVREIKDFPKEGIDFKDITTLLQDGKALKFAIDEFIADLKDKNVDIIELFSMIICIIKKNIRI